LIDEVNADGEEGAQSVVDDVDVDMGDVGANDCKGSSVAEKSVRTIISQHFNFWFNHTT
jgi:hypothetical protein